MVPNPNVNDPADVQALEDAKESVGDYKLKTDSSFVPSEEDINTVGKKFSELLAVKEEIHKHRNDYNQTIFQTREEKVSLCEYVQGKIAILKKIHEELPMKNVQTVDPVPQIFSETEFAENRFKV